MVRLCESYSGAGATVVASREYAKSLGKVRANPYEDPDGAGPVHVFMWKRGSFSVSMCAHCQPGAKQLAHTICYPSASAALEHGRMNIFPFLCVP